MVSFSHRDPGTPEEDWLHEIRARALTDFDEGFDELLVVAAHPDDETLGVGGLIRMAARRGAGVTVLVATDGENSHPQSPSHTPAALADIRRSEVRDSLQVLCPTADIRFLGITDGTLRENEAALAGAVGSALNELERRSSSTLAVAPWSGDGHRDHRVAGEVTAAESRTRGVEFRGYPLWAWHWGAPAEFPWTDAESVVLDDDARSAKAAALGRHRSQIAPLSDEAGDEVILHPRMQSHFDRDVEVLMRAPQPATHDSLSRSYFDSFYARHDDPWGFDSRWYEQRKRALLLASLPSPRYTRALELGCSTGALTFDLAARCDQLLAVDFAQSALDVARDRLAGASNVRLSARTLPHEWPEGEFDLVVLSEVGYYWSEADLELAVDRIDRSLSATGHLVACHWRHAVADYPISGDDVHDALRNRSGLPRLARHEEEDFVMEVFGRPPGESVARATGLLG